MRASLPTDAPPFPSKQQQQNKQPTLGPDAHPLYKFLKAALPDDAPGAPSPRPRGAEAGAIAWNYTKFLIGRDGAPLARYKPGFDPLEFEGDGAAAGGAFVVVNARGGGGGERARALSLLGARSCGAVAFPLVPCDPQARPPSSHALFFLSHSDRAQYTQHTLPPLRQCASRSPACRRAAASASCTPAAPAALWTSCCARRARWPSKAQGLKEACKSLRQRLGRETAGSSSSCCCCFAAIRPC